MPKRKRLQRISPFSSTSKVAPPTSKVAPPASIRFAFLPFIGEIVVFASRNRWQSRRKGHCNGMIRERKKIAVEEINKHAYIVLHFFLFQRRV